MPRIYPAKNIVTFDSITGNLEKDKKVTLTGCSILTERFTVVVEKVTDKPNSQCHEGNYYLGGNQCYYLIDVTIGETYFKSVTKNELKKIEECKYYSDDEDERTVPIDYYSYLEHDIPTYVFSAIIGSIVTLI